MMHRSRSQAGMDPGFGPSSTTNMAGASSMNTSGVGTVGMYGSPNGTGSTSFRRATPSTGAQL